MAYLRNAPFASMVKQLGMQIVPPILLGAVGFRGNTLRPIAKPESLYPEGAILKSARPKAALTLR